MNYVDFASKVSFYEFLQEEFRPPDFNTEKYKKEIEVLKGGVTIEQLTKLLEDNAKIIDIVEELLQLKRFTNTQYINFCFDVNILNNAEESLILKYIRNSVFKFENGKPNNAFCEIYTKLTETPPNTETETIFLTKRTIVRYVESLIKKRKALYHHIENSIGARLRISKYLIENLNVHEFLSSVKLKDFLIQKRHPIDTKGLHGKFGTIKISKVLQDAGFRDMTSNVTVPILSSKGMCIEQTSQNAYSYIREKAIEDINKRKDGKPKKFDFILLYKGAPKILIETNFYSTSGTKIGINEGEYVYLYEDIKKFNEHHNTHFQFIWITDGNYWLSRDGESRFINLKRNFFKGEFDLLNYQLFRNALPQIKNNMV